MRSWKQGSAVVFVILALAAVGCDRQEGPFEEAGEAVDNAADEVEDAAE